MLRLSWAVTTKTIWYIFINTILFGTLFILTWTYFGNINHGTRIVSLFVLRLFVLHIMVNLWIHLSSFLWLIVWIQNVQNFLSKLSKESLSKLSTDSLLWIWDHISGINQKYTIFELESDPLDIRWNLLQCFDMFQCHMFTLLCRVLLIFVFWNRFFKFLKLKHNNSM